VKRLLALSLPVALAAVVVALAQPVEGTKYALIIGVAKYDGTGLTNLKYAEKDATDLKAALEALGYRVTLVTKAEYRKTDKDDRDPTAENVRDHLSAITRNRKADDTVLVAFSGHGVHLKATNKLYYCPARANLEKTETLVAIDDVMAALGPYDGEKGCKANSKMLIMDACRNDPTDGRAATDGRLASLTRPLVPDPPGGTVALFSCSKGQISHESERFERGFLMHFVIDALSGKAANSKGVISWDKLVAHVKDEVPSAVVDQKGPRANQLPDSVGRASVLVLGQVEVPGGPMDRVVPPPPAKGNTYASKTTGMKFVRIPKGTFTMGSPKTEKDRLDNESEREVTISKDFFLGVYEVTQKEYAAVTGKTPSHFKGDDLPVESVTWDEAVAFAKALSEKDGETYRLPTEAEWEYACRAGQTGPYGFASGNKLEDYAWYTENSDSKTHPVGTKKANTFGLHDMHGNAWEWCSDWYGFYPSGRVTDPTGPTTGSDRVDRGGGWDFSARGCRSAYRFGFFPSIRDGYLGFRLSLVPSGR